MKVIDFRVVVDDETYPVVDIPSILTRILGSHREVLGAVELVPDGFGRLTANPDHAELSLRLRTSEGRALVLDSLKTGEVK